MADLQTAATTTLTTAAASTTPTTTPALTAIQVAVADISQELEALTHAIQTGATPVAAPTGNTLTLTTALGNITVTLPQLSTAEQQSLLQQLINLAQNQRPLTLALQPGSPPGSPPTQAVLLIPSSTLATQPQNPITPPQNPTLPGLPLAVGETLPAIVLPTNISLPASAAPLPPALPTLPIQPGETPTNETPVATPQPLAQAISQAMPQPSVSAPALTASLATQNSPSQTAPPSPPVTPLTLLLQPGNEVTLRIDAVLPPTQTTLPPLAANQIVATVAGTGTDGQLILKAGDTTLFVKAQASAPAGSSVIVTVETARPAPLLTLPPLNQTNFPALPQAMAALAQIDPQILQQMIAHLPQPADSLPGALLFLFSAFKQGNVRGWLGSDVADTLLHAGKMDIVGSLSRELGGAGQSAQDSVVGEWRSYPIPLYSEAQFQALTLYVHNERSRREERENGSATGIGKVRFLIDMRLSKLGAMQLDGFVQPKKLDMILRSENSLPEGLHHNLRASYIKAMGAVGYTGSLNFQVGRHHWLTMQRQATQGIVT